MTVDLLSVENVTLTTTMGNKAMMKRSDSWVNMWSHEAHSLHQKVSKFTATVLKTTVKLNQTYRFI
ncbi:hypothetical protein IRJ41_015757, partial [Triplophysa rosa]